MYQKIYSYRINEGIIVDDKKVYNQVIFKLKVNMNNKRYTILNNNEDALLRDIIMNSQPQELGILEDNYGNKTRESLQNTLLRIQNDIMTLEKMHIISDEYETLDDFIKDILMQEYFRELE